MPEKKKRKNAAKLRTAVTAAAEASAAIQDMETAIAEMTPNQKGIFESVMSGDEPVITALKTGNTGWFTGIVKKVFIKDEPGPFNSTDVSLENIYELADNSYTYLNRVCSTRVRQFMRDEDYHKHISTVREYLKRFAPLALGTIIDIAQNGEKEENRLKAAKDLLDRAGEREPEPEREMVVPVQVNIMLTDGKGKVVQYE